MGRGRQPSRALVRVVLHLTLTCAGIILGTHHEKGAFTFWSYAIGLPLPSSAILSWKFCHVLHKVLRDGHPNVSSGPRSRAPQSRTSGPCLLRPPRPSVPVGARAQDPLSLRSSLPSLCRCCTTARGTGATSGRSGTCG